MTTAPKHLETPRLILRPFEADDAPAVFAYRSDPLVMKFVPSGPDRSLAQTERLIEQFQEHQRTCGFSKWAITLKATGAVIGDAGLLLLARDYDPEVGHRLAPGDSHPRLAAEGGDAELGYRLSREHWRHGFATESGRAWLGAAFSLFGRERVVAFVHPDHVASIRILSKLGMLCERLTRFYGMEASSYSMTREAWTREVGATRPISTDASR